MLIQSARMLVLCCIRTVCVASCSSAAEEDQETRDGAEEKLGYAKEGHGEVMGWNYMMLV